MARRAAHTRIDRSEQVRRTIGIPTCSLALVKRFRIACIEDGRTAEQMLIAMLDTRDRNLARARNLMTHPLDRLGAEAAAVDA
jgi:hypothetical protein